MASSHDWDWRARPRSLMADPFDSDPLEIVRGSAADIPSLEPLWVAVHHVHGASMPELAPYVSDEDLARAPSALR